MFENMLIIGVISKINETPFTCRHFICNWTDKATIYSLQSKRKLPSKGVNEIVPYNLLNKSTSTLYYFLVTRITAKRKKEAGHPAPRYLSWSNFNFANASARAVLTGSSFC
jgi:hypothetical protein